MFIAFFAFATVALRARLAPAAIAGAVVDDAGRRDRLGGDPPRRAARPGLARGDPRLHGHRGALGQRRAVRATHRTRPSRGRGGVRAAVPLLPRSTADGDARSLRPRPAVPTQRLAEVELRRDARARRRLAGEHRGAPRAPDARPRCRDRFRRPALRHRQHLQRRRGIRRRHLGGAGTDASTRRRPRARCSGISATTGASCATASAPTASATSAGARWPTAASPPARTRRGTSSARPHRGDESRASASRVSRLAASDE